jgi:lipopolysaccharide/colanic/teichoic acid biosynthesis glycosyltransferase
MSNPSSLLATTPTAGIEISTRDDYRFNAVHRNHAFRVKRTIDLGGALTAIFLLSPVLILAAIAVRLSSPGPALFRQKRIGLDRRPFTIFKFRSMRMGVGDEVGRQELVSELKGDAQPVDGSFKPAAGPQITRVGAFLRKTSLDELPQLFNVLFGEMSLVGPRPCLPWEAELFGSAHSDRFNVKPGITGLWQVSGRSLLDTRQMLLLDVQYASGFSIAGDLRILLQTIPAVLRTDGAR